MSPDESEILSELVKYYDALAPYYDAKYSHPTIHHMRTIERQLIDRYLDASIKRVLDLGCGTGLHTVQLAQYGREVVGIDISPEMIRLAQRRVEDAGLSDRVRFVVSEIDNIPSAIGEQFDAAISMFGALNHIPDLSFTLQNVARALRSGAPLIFTVANAERILSRTQSSNGWIQLRVGTRGLRLWTRVWTRRDIETALIDSGYDVVRAGGIFSLIRPVYSGHVVVNRNSPFNRILMWLERRLAWNTRLARRAEYLIFVARRV